MSDRYDEKAYKLLSETCCSKMRFCPTDVSVVAQDLRESAAEEIDNMISIMSNRQKEVYSLTLDAWICGMKDRARELRKQAAEK